MFPEGYEQTIHPLRQRSLVFLPFFHEQFGKIFKMINFCPLREAMKRLLRSLSKTRLADRSTSIDVKSLMRRLQPDKHQTGWSSARHRKAPQATPPYRNPYSVWGNLETCSRPGQARPVQVKSGQALARICSTHRWPGSPCPGWPRGLGSNGSPRRASCGDRWRLSSPDQSPGSSVCSPTLPRCYWALGPEQKHGSHDRTSQQHIQTLWSPEWADGSDAHQIQEYRRWYIKHLSFERDKRNLNNCFCKSSKISSEHRHYKHYKQLL